MAYHLLVRGRETDDNDEDTTTMKDNHFVNNNVVTLIFDNIEITNNKIVSKNVEVSTKQTILLPLNFKNLHGYPPFRLRDILQHSCIAYSMQCQAPVEYALLFNRSTAKTGYRNYQVHYCYYG